MSSFRVLWATCSWSTLYPHVTRVVYYLVVLDRYSLSITLAVSGIESSILRFLSASRAFSSSSVIERLIFFIANSLPPSIGAYRNLYKGLGATLLVRIGGNGCVMGLSWRHGK